MGQKNRKRLGNQKERKEILAARAARQGSQAQQPDDQAQQPDDQAQQPGDHTQQPEDAGQQTEEQAQQPEDEAQQTQGQTQQAEDFVQQCEGQTEQYQATPVASAHAEPSEPSEPTNPSTICGPPVINTATYPNNPSRGTHPGYGSANTRSSQQPAIQAINQRAAKDQPLIKRPCTELAIYESEADTSSEIEDSSVITNYLGISCDIRKIYVYNIEISGPPAADNATPTSITRRSERKHVFKALLEQDPLRHHQDYATDYTTLWLGSPLGGVHNRSHHVSNLRYHKYSGKIVNLPLVELQYATTLDFSGNQLDLAGRATANHNPNELKRALNAMVTRCVADNSDTVFESGQNTFYIKGSSDKFDDIDLIQILRGYFVSVRPGADSVLLNVNICHGAFLKPILVSEFIDEFQSNPQYRDNYKSYESCLKGRLVRIIYSQQSTSPDYDADDYRQRCIVQFGRSPSIQMMSFRSGEEVSVETYFNSFPGMQHRKFRNLPCVNVGAIDSNEKKKSNWIPAELLELEPQQAFGKQLGPIHMQEMKSVALMKPADNHMAIEVEGIDFLGLRQIAGPLKTHLQLSAPHPNLMRIPANVLPAPGLRYSRFDRGDHSVNPPIVHPRNASWTLQGVQFAKPEGKLTLPVCILDLRRGKDDWLSPLEIAEAWRDRCEVHGMLSAKSKNVCISRKVDVPDIGDANFYNTFQAALQPAAKSLREEKERLGQELRFILVLLPSDDAKVYGVLKHLLEVYAGRHSICITPKKLMDDNYENIFSNMILKQNLKSAGINHFVMDAPSSTRSAFAEIQEDTMVMGVDVVHPGGNMPSIAAMVASINGEMATFAGHVRLQPGRKEILTPENIDDMANACRAQWQGKRRPRRIIYYRDGVGDSDYNAVLESEVARLRPVFGVESITAVIVGKRHHTRFFASNEESSYTERKRHGVVTNGNVKPGTLVKSVITQPSAGSRDKFTDFFLQSHAALDGTAKSAHYVVVCNADLSMDSIQRITHAFCYNYARATKGVSYCAPAYYADRLCDRAHHYFKAYLAGKPRTFDLNDAEKLMPKPQGEIACRNRIRDEVAQDWLTLYGRGNPWRATLNGTMFWL